MSGLAGSALRIFGATAVLPLVLSILAVTSLQASAQEMAGVVERIRGEATRYDENGGTQLIVGSSINVDDTVSTAADSRLLVRFLDGSELTLGENARIVVDEFIFSADATSGPESAQTLAIFQGVFRFTSGVIGAADYDNVSIRTPVATIGIRGTEFIGGELFVGMPPGRPHYGFQIKDGAIQVSTPAGSVLLDEPGEGTFIPIVGTVAPTPVRQWSPAEADEAEDKLRF